MAQLQFKTTVFGHTSGEIMQFTKLAAILISALFATFMFLDWYSIVANGTVNPYTFWLKYCVTLICVGVAWKAHSHSINRRDTRLFRIAYSFIALADFFLVLLCGIVDSSPAKPTLFAAGVASFAVVQIFLIIRHAAAIRAADPPKSHIFIVLLPIVAVLLLYTPAVAAAIVFREHLIALGWFAIVVLIYGFLLITSLWVAWGTKIYSAHGASMMIALGMTCFLFCDICVASQMFITGWLAAVANGLVWLFYVPALLLLALSGYRNQIGA